MLILSLLCIVGVVSASSDCIWAVGKLVCNKDTTRVKNAVVEVYDLDGPKEIPFIDIIFPDDKAGFTVVEDESGEFKVEGCASDFDWLEPLHLNRPEFYFKIRHTCNSDELKEISVYPPDMQVFAPNTMDYFVENPIVLDD